VEILIRRSYMSNKRNQRPKSLPVVNYSSAIARAVKWLGDRYLLAQPINEVAGHEAAEAAHSPPYPWQSLTSFQERYRNRLRRSHLN
jgi:hypothetical protein